MKNKINKKYSSKRQKISILIERKWAMPSRWTFTIRPIKNLLREEIGLDILEIKKWIDPFAGKHSLANYTNDLNPNMPTQEHISALEYLKKQKDNNFDGCLYDPPYSPRQVKECYASIGLQCFNEDTKMTFWSKCKDEIARIIKPNGKVICCGWNSMGLGLSRGFTMTRILLVPHGGSKNDTIITVEFKD